MKRTGLERTPQKSGTRCGSDAVSIVRQSRADDVSDLREGGMRSTVPAWYDGDRDFEFFGRE